jgi:CRP/FNR family cyclic AMP-dependent transcriptional regulator
MVTAEILKRFDLFKGVPDDSLAALTKLCNAHTMQEGDRIFAEGAKAKDLHLCRTGKVDILIWVREPWNKNIAVHRAMPGELFGWSALVAPYTYTASADCVESGEEILISGSELLTFFSQNPVIGYEVMGNISATVSARLTQTRQRLVTEWLSSGWPASSGTWGEQGKR